MRHQAREREEQGRRFACSSVTDGKHAGTPPDEGDQDLDVGRGRTRAASGGRRRTAPAAPLLRGAMLGLAVLALVGARPLHGTRDVLQVTKIMADSPHTGECEQCHQAHGDELGQAEINQLKGPDDNTLCAGCHEPTWTTGSYPGSWIYNGSSHGSNPAMVWPGPDPMARTDPGAAGKCLNCHDPHGWDDAQGRIPSLAFAREENLCLACHGGAPASDNIRADLLKPYRHPVSDISGRHKGPTESDPTDFGVTPLDQRHSECVDCHNPHVARHDAPGTPVPPDASKRLLGVSRLQVLNGAAGNVPSYRFLAASDTLTAPVTDYSLCFKCHSSWTTQPGGQSDLALLLNPSNPSYHPVEGVGRDLTLNPLSFATGWTAASLTGCGDCHGSDAGGSAGPHGSIYRYILQQPYTASPAPRAMTSDEMCFKCHAYDVYANPSSPVSTRAASRFNAPNVSQGHAEHVGSLQVPCYACHATHGSTTLSHLLVTGRSPGIVGFTETAGGGTCAPTCHASQTYSVNYGR